MPIRIQPLSRFRIFSLILLLLCFLMMFLPWIQLSAGFLGESENESLSLFRVGRKAFDNATCVWIVMLKLGMVLSFPAMAAALLGLLTDRPLLTAPVAALAVLMFLFDMFAVFWAKGRLSEMLGGYIGALSASGTVFGAHMGAGCWLFLFFGLGVFGFLCYEDQLRGLNPLDPAQLSLRSQTAPPGDAAHPFDPPRDAACPSPPEQDVPHPFPPARDAAYPSSSGRDDPHASLPDRDDPHSSSDRDDLHSSLPDRDNGDPGERELVKNTKRRFPLDRRPCFRYLSVQSSSQSSCTSCGAPKPKALRCPRCGRAARPGSAFCSACGARL